MKVIAITGTPGTGKTTLSKKLSKKMGYLYFDVNQFIVKNKLYEGYDRKRKTRVVDVSKLNKKLVDEIKSIEPNKKYKGVIIDSHLSHYLPRKYVDFCIITKCSIKELDKRLKKKRFHGSKIAENIQAEIFDICLNEAKERGHKAIVADTTKGFNTDRLTKRVGR